LYDLLEQMNNFSPSGLMGEFVDDLHLLVVHAQVKLSQVLDSMARRLFRCRAGRKAAASPKAALLASKGQPSQSLRGPSLRSSHCHGEDQQGPPGRCCSWGPTKGVNL